MKKLILLLLAVCLCAGCTEPQVAATTASLATWVVLAENVQDDLVETVNRGVARKKELDEKIAESDGLIIIRPETIEALNQLRDKKGKIDWTTLALGLFGGGTATNIFKNRKK